MKLRGEVAMFAVGGVIGLLIDASIVQGLVSIAHWNPYPARAVSFVVAASFTWWWNRRHTFAARPSGHAAHHEWLRWMALMSIGAVVNYGVYVVALWCIPEWRHWPALAAAAGSAVAAAVNFSAARVALFRGAETSA